VDPRMPRVHCRTGPVGLEGDNGERSRNDADQQRGGASRRSRRNVVQGCGERKHQGPTRDKGNGDHPADVAKCKNARPADLVPLPDGPTKLAQESPLDDGHDQHNRKKE
jgi:hypothetical protein